MTLSLADLPYADSVPLEVSRGFARADELVAESEVLAAVDRLAVRLTVDLQDANPVVLAVLHGGLYFTGMLLQRLVFPLQQGYVHVARYGLETTGGELEWHGHAHPPLAGRHVVLVDDILDRGTTLKALETWALREGAAQVDNAVLVRKRVDRQETEAAYCAIECEDRYLFGCGMDYMEYGRNLPSVYALTQ
jgi:hypoxanthine phosphoribosyltransferase